MLGNGGQRLEASAPFGHWKTMTFIAALRHDRITAPWVIDGPINGELFTLYVEKVLAPTLLGGFLANDGRAVRQAAEVGYGIAFLPWLEVFDDLRSGELVRLLSGFPAPGMPVSLVYPSRRHLAPRTRLVMEFVLDQVREVRSMLAVEDQARSV
jgi:DNA-binding transcriptional LysR family regulator